VLEPGFYLQPLVVLQGPEAGVSCVAPTTGLPGSVWRAVARHGLRSLDAFGLVAVP